MTERERCWIEYQRSYRSARRIVALTVIVLVGMLLGYTRGHVTDARAPFTAGAAAP